MKTIILCFALFALIECRKIGVNSKSHKNGNTVEVGVYFESLCPDCKDFVIQQLFPTFNKLFNATPHIMTINLVPFGFAAMDFNNSTKNPSVTFKCQHGKDECDANIIESCAVIKYDIEKSLPFIYCMHSSSKNPWIAAKECAEKLNLDFNLLNGCATSEEGVAIEYFMGGQTNSLQPQPNWVPWITINGQHTDDIQQKATSNLVKLVCDSYQGSPKPKPCKLASIGWKASLK